MPLRRLPERVTSLGSYGDAMLTLTAVAWALNITGTKVALTHGFAPLVYAASRNALGGVIIAMLAYWREKSLVIHREDLVAVLVAALLGVSLNQLCVSYSLDVGAASAVALVFGIGPVATSVVAWVVGVENLTARRWLAAIVSSLGVACVGLGSGGGGTKALLGVGLALGATLSFAVYSVLLMPLLRRYSVLRLNAVIILVGSLPLAVAVVPEVPKETWSAITPMAWTAWAYGLLISYALGSVTWALGVRLVGASRASLYANVQPFAGAIFAALLLSERVGAVVVMGGLLTAGGVLLGSLKRGPDVNLPSKLQ